MVESFAPDLLSVTAVQCRRPDGWWRLGYGELRDWVRGLGTSLLAAGVRPADRVGFLSENRSEWVITYLAVTCVGAVIVPLDVLLKELLIDPLGMKDTAFWVPADKASRLAETLDADPLKAAMVKSYRVFSNPAGKSYFKGGAGLVGTAEDYLRFCQMLVNGGEYQGKRYLSKKTVEFNNDSKGSHKKL